MKSVGGDLKTRFRFGIMVTKEMEVVRHRRKGGSSSEGRKDIL